MRAYMTKNLSKFRGILLIIGDQIDYLKTCFHLLENLNQNIYDELAK